jgi:hypothetical protein
LAHTQSTSDTLRPWQFFTLGALISATAAVFIVRGTSPENVILVCLGIFAAALVALAALRTLRPLVSDDFYRPEMVGSHTRAALEREKNLLLRSIKELEFDSAMGKVAAGDYDEMVGRLRSRAVRLLQQLDTAGSGYRELIERELASRLVKAGAAPLAEADESAAESVSEPDQAVMRERGDVAGKCAACSTSNDADARFCKGCGTKLLALLFAILAFAAPSLAQIQMPDPREMAGIPRPVTDLPEGHISVRLIRGQLSNNIQGHPVELHAAGKVITVNTDAAGRAEFSGVAAGTNVKAVAVVDGERLESQEFPAPGQGGIRLLLVATPKGGSAPPPRPQAQSGTVALGDQNRIIIDLGDDALQVYYVLDIQNSASVPVSPASALMLDMPTGSRSAAILGGATEAVVRGDRVTLTGPFPPGQTAIQVGYQLPFYGGDVSLTQAIPLAVPSVAVLMKKVGNMTLTSLQLPTLQEREFDGERYILAQGPGIPAGGTLTLEITGLPHHSPVPRQIALTLAMLMIAGGVWAGIRRPPPTGNAARVKQLSGKREKIFNDLVRLEQQRRTGTIDPARYAERRPALIAQLERVYRDMDAEGGHGLAA